MNRNTLLIVDDMEINRVILRSQFEKTYNILEAQNGVQALMLLNQYHEMIEAVLLDIVMPVKDGFEVLKEMTRTRMLDRIPVIVITSESTSDNELRVFDMGASDILVKPFEPHVVRRRVQNIIDLNKHKLHLEELVKEQSRKLNESKEVLLDALSSVIEHRSIESGQHVLRIRMFTKVLLEVVMKNYPEYGLDERKIEIIASASSMHDIGKIAIPDAILNKPGALTAEEFEIMKTHSVKGCEILSRLERMDDKEYLQYAYNICRYHHERWDGGGYPQGLQGENIPICAQVVSIADAYDALTTDRVYKKAYSPAKAYNTILNGECGAFSPRLLECFKSVKGKFEKLVKQYADGKIIPKSDNSIIGNSAILSDIKNPLELAQMKYFALMRYAEANIIEVDVDSGIYHIVYTQNSDLDIFRTGEVFYEVFLNFVNTCVHPDDREMIMQTNYLDELFKNGLMKYSRSYRIFNNAAGEYVPYNITTLRVKLEDPNLHKIIILWHKSECNASAKQIDVSELYFDNPMIGVLSCVNDKSFTIRQVNDGFLSLFGYNRDELKEKFNNCYLEMIHINDRKKMLDHYNNQILLGNTTELEYRVYAKDRPPVWILEKSQIIMGNDGKEYVSCILLDVSKYKEEQLKLNLLMQRHEIIMNQTNDIIFEWDIREHTLNFSSNWQKKYGYVPITENVNFNTFNSSHVLPEDSVKLDKLMADLSSGAGYGEIELRVANAKGKYIWSKIRATTQFDEQGVPVKAVGVIVDIDSEKRKYEDLLKLAEHDQLTQLYNKGAARQYIHKLLNERKNKKLSCMMLIDLDNFKLVNDLHGHLYGDAVLVEVATQLKRIFPNDCIVSRIGGDEYLVYVDNIPTRKTMKDYADAVVSAIAEILADEKLVSLSCSIGIALAPKDANNYQDLFQCCDTALYEAKTLGKNRYVIFNSSLLIKSRVSSSSIYKILGTRIDSDENYNQDITKIIQQAIHMIYQSSDIETAVQSIMELLGRKYNVSRCYIFEDIDDGKATRNTFEWCNEGFKAEKENLQNVLYSELGKDYHENFNENGIFYCSDIAKLPKEQYDLMSNQGIHSMLQCAILDSGKFVGFVGFDECVSTRMWTQTEVTTLAFISKLLSISILKQRAQEKASKSSQDLISILNAQNEWIYVIDPISFKLLYINQKTHNIAPTVKLGMPCYEAFFDREIPCERCPAKDILVKKNRTMEVYNPVLHVWTIADASKIPWSGQDACLLACQDITAYKQLEKINSTGDKNEEN